ncbi:MAG: hypothetical protein J1E64_11725 [Acetatifactor sp.]|nr:hypothetical protein [Acetatifactor sp.]
MIEWIVTSSILIAAVLLIRLCLKSRISAGIRYGLWLVVLIRLLLPMNFLDSRVSVLNLLPERGIIVKEDLAKDGEEKADDRTESGLPMNGAESMSGNTNSAVWNDIPMPTPSGMQAVPQQSPQPSKLQTKDNDRERTEEWLITLVQTIVWNVWWLGAVVCGFGMFWSNLRFRRKLRREVTLLSAGHPPVYMSENVKNPFMFGVLKPVIFVPESVTKEKEVFAFVLSHERTHYAHGDHIWAFLRAVCLCVHWYNPLVWIAADRSRQDAELACDETVLRQLEADRRMDYGKALIALSVERGRGELSDNLKLATTMSGSKKQLKERIQMITKSPRMAAGTAVLAALLVVIVSMVTFTGKSEAAQGSQGDNQSAEEQQEDEDRGDTDEVGEDDAEHELTFAEELIASGESSIFGHWGYTGYMDEAVQYDGYGSFVNCDYDQDGLTDRVYRTSKGDDLCDYQIEFGNGDMLLIPDGSDTGFPMIQSGDLNGDGRQEIVFSWDYSMSTDPTAAGDFALYEWQDGDYRQAELPMGTSPKGVYSPCLTVRYEALDEPSFLLMVEETGEQIEVIMDRDDWEWNEPVFGDNVSEITPYSTLIVAEPTEGAPHLVLKCHFGIFDKWWDEELMATIEYDPAQDAYRIREVAGVRDYQTEMVPINLGTTDRQYYLKVNGYETTADPNYRIKRVDLYCAEQGQEERRCWNMYELSEALLSYWGVDYREVIHSDMDGGLLVEDLNGDGYEEFGISYNGNPGMWYVWQWVPEAEDPEQGTFVFAGLVRKGRTQGGIQQVSYSNSRYTADSAIFTTTYAKPGADGVVELDRVDWSIHKYLPDGGEEVRETTLHFMKSVYLGWSQMADGVYTYQDHDKQYQRVDVAYLAGLAMEELYETTGYWVEECYFDVATGGSFYFANSAEDMLHSRVFYDRSYGVDGVIPRINIAYRELVWFSDVTQNLDVSQGFMPENYGNMSDEEMLVWFLENTPIGNKETVKAITMPYIDTYTAETKEGHFYEMIYSKNKYSAPISINITGPYLSYPEH